LANAKALLLAMQALIKRRSSAMGINTRTSGTMPMLQRTSIVLQQSQGASAAATAAASMDAAAGAIAVNRVFPRAKKAV
jgi:hypothetical protein